MIAVRAGNHCRQERADVLVVTGGQPFDGAVLALATKSMSGRRPASARILSSEPASRRNLKAITRSGAVIVALLAPARDVADGTTRQRHRRLAHPRQLPAGTGPVPGISPTQLRPPLTTARLA